MVDYSSFITILKAAWIERLIYTETNWIKILESTMKISVNTLGLIGRDFSYTNKHILEGIVASWLQIDEKISIK